MPAEFKPGVYKYRHRYQDTWLRGKATAELSEELGYVRFTWQDGSWDQWPIDMYLDDWEFAYA